MSDTHSLTSHIKFDIPDGDIFIHAGDFTKCGGLEEVIDFNNWIGNKLMDMLFSGEGVLCSILPAYHS